MEYDYFTGFHDLSLPEWGPYSKNYFGISHLASRKRGLRFDFTVMPAIYRRALGIPDGLRPVNYLPWSSSADLEVYSYRQQLEARDVVYAEISFCPWDKNARLIECRNVNNGVLPTQFGIHLIASLEAPPERSLVPVLPAGAVWVDALSHLELVWAEPRPQDNLVFDALRRGEVRESGTVGGGCIGAGFGRQAGDRLLFQVPDGHSGRCAAALRCKLEAGAVLPITLNGILLTLTGSGQWQLVPCAGVPIADGQLQLVSGGGAELKLDGLIVGAECGEFVEPDGLTPEILPGPVPDSRILRFGALEQVYGVWWSERSDFVRFYRAADRNHTLYYEDCVHQPFFGGQIADAAGQEWVDIVMQPISAEPESAATVHAVVCAGSEAEVTAALMRAEQERASLPGVAAAARQHAWKPVSTASGEEFWFSRERLAAVTLTNVGYPTRIKGQNVRHRSPGRRWNSLYTWDSGFIGLGLLELGLLPALENLNAYLTEPDDREAAFIHHGSPVPVQFYLFAELMNRDASAVPAALLYPKLKHYYEFMAGRAPSSTMRGRSRKTLIRSWDYFYNSGGWDDYPPQWFLTREQRRDAAPAVVTSHVIRAARIMAATARELGLAQEAASYEEDIADLSGLLQHDSWDEEAGYFGYLCYDQEEKPAGILRHSSGANFNQGLDGASPLLAGVCTPEQKSKLWAKLASRERCWTPFGLSTVDRSAPYFRPDGYWNGSIWMPYQWLFWKAALDDGRADFAWRIAETALRIYETEVRNSYGCYEHFMVSTGRGGGWPHFSGLSTPVLSWFGAYFVPGRLTGGFDTRIRRLHTSARHWRAEVEVDGTRRENSTVIAVVSDGVWRAVYQEDGVPVRQRCPGTVEVTLPRGSSGVLELFRE